MYTLTPRCHLQPVRRSPAACQAATTTTTTPTTPFPPRPSSSLSIPPRAADRDDDELRSTWPQRAWTLAGTAAILSSLSTSASLAASSSGGGFPAAAEPLAAALAAYSLADLATGVYHWLVDNYGDASTPLLGSQIAAFQGHHRRPSTITRREPCNNLHALARGAALALLPVDAALSAAGAGAGPHAFVGCFAACVVLSQQFHTWAHEKRRRLPPGVEALQRAGVLVSRAQHGAHHRAPYDTNYCIVSGMWNGVLDRYRVFEALEMVVFFRTGVRPRSWDETDASWKEDTGAEAEAADAAAGNDGLLQTAGISSDSD